MYYVGKFDEGKLAVPSGYERHSQGYERFSLVDHSVGSVRMGVGICRLQAKGSVQPGFTPMKRKSMFFTGRWK
jgi:hypothetical protein